MRFPAIIPFTYRCRITCDELHADDEQCCSQLLRCADDTQCQSCETFSGFARDINNSLLNTL